MTRTVVFINQLFLNLEKKNYFFKEVFSFALFTLFFGFLIGNLFGTFLNLIRSFIFWDGLIIFIILSVMEFLNFFLYKKTNRFLKVFENIYYSVCSFKKNAFSNTPNVSSVTLLLTPPAEVSAKQTSDIPNNPSNISKGGVRCKVNKNKVFDYGAATFNILKGCQPQPRNQNKFFWKSLNFLKIGIMFGFFIDAFKVGS